MKIRHIKNRNHERLVKRPYQEHAAKRTLIHHKFDDIFVIMKLKEMSIYEYSPSFFRSDSIKQDKKIFYIGYEHLWDNDLTNKTSSISPKWAFKRFLDMVKTGEV